MQKRIVINNGKKYHVNVVGWGDGVGPGAPIGTLWMPSENEWYSINITGTSGSAAIKINQTPLAWVSPGGQEFEYQLLYCSDNGNVYQTYLSGSEGSVDMLISSVPWSNPTDYKPYLLLQSVTDGYFYRVYAKLTGPTISLFVDPNSRIWMLPGNPWIFPTSGLPWNQLLIVNWENMTTVPWENILP